MQALCSEIVGDIEFYITKHKIPCARTTFLASMEKQQHLDTATNLASFHVTQSPCKKVISCCLQTGVIHHKPYVRKPPLPRQTVATTPPSCEAVRRCALPSVVWCGCLAKATSLLPRCRAASLRLGQPAWRGFPRPTDTTLDTVSTILNFRTRAFGQTHFFGAATAATGLLKGLLVTRVLRLRLGHEPRSTRGFI